MIPPGVNHIRRAPVHRKYQAGQKDGKVNCRRIVYVL